MLQKSLSIVVLKQAKVAPLSKHLCLADGQFNFSCTISKQYLESEMRSSYPDGHQGGEMWGTLNSRLDATWQDRLLGMEGSERAELETIWAEMDKIMKTLHPTHTRRMKFLSMKPQNQNFQLRLITKRK